MKLIPAVSCIVFNQRPSLWPSTLKVLLIKREKDPYMGKWTFPGGKQNPGETISEATKREVQEETGYEVALFHES